MTNLIPQAYKQSGKVFFKTVFLRKLALIIIKTIFPKKRSFFRNIFLQQFQSFIDVSVNNIKLKFKDGNERLFLFLNTQYIIEKDLINWINDFTKEDIFLDIGSNVGMYSIYSAKKGNLTICCEGHPANLSDFLYNVHLNKVENNIITLPILLSDANRTSDFFLRDFTSSSARSSIDHKNSYYKNDFKFQEAMIVKTLNFSLDSFLDEKLIPVPSKIKLDVDGFEFFILKGMSKYLEYVDEIMVEMFEYDVNIWKCYYDNKNLENIDTRKDFPNYFGKYFKNPYYKDIINYLNEFSFKEKSRYGNNIIFKNYSKKEYK